jgi:hypothetical protein
MSISLSARHSLTEEQRQQIIEKLLADRRGQAVAAAPAGRLHHSELPAEERAARLQELISKRAAAKQQQGKCHGEQHLLRPGSRVEDNRELCCTVWMLASQELTQTTA